MDLITIPFHDSPITAALIDGAPHVALRPVCEAMGIDYSAQYRRLQRTPWARVAMAATHDATGRLQDMVMIDRRTFTMWLATIDAARLKTPGARGAVEVFQSEAADALDAYFHDGGAINPTASPEQLETLQDQIVDLVDVADRRLRMLGLARGLISPPDYGHTRSGTGMAGQ